MIVRKEISYLALAVCILTDMTPDQAFEKVAPECGGKLKLTNEDVEDMIKLKETMTFKQVGKIFNIKGNSVYRKIKRHLAQKAS